MRRIGSLAAAAVAMGWCAGAATAQSDSVGEGPPIVLDGSFDDWAAVPIAAEDAAGDAIGGFDLTRVRVAMRGTRLLLNFDNAATPVNLQSGLPGDSTLRITVEDEEGDRIELDTRLRRVGVTFEGQIDVGNWTLCDYTALPTYASDQFEMTIDVAPIGVEPGDVVSVTFGGSDELDAPLEVRVNRLSPAARAASVQRPTEADVRVFSLNTLRQGIVNARRAPLIGGMLSAIAPDVVFLQEEWQTSPGAAEAALDQLAPVGNDGGWNVHKNNGCMVASPWEVVPAPAFNNRYAAAIVVPDGDASRAMLAISIHFKCCGFAGSNEDNQRVEQALAVAQTIEAVRDADEGSALWPYRDAPAIVAGDFNLVGSRDPLALLVDDASGPQLAEVEMLDPSGSSAVTWVDRGSDFSPGRLDLAAIDGGIELLNAFVFDTRSMRPGERQQLGLEADQSIEASDHKALVFDIVLPESP